MFCENCGTDIPEGGVFCPNCGARQSAQAPQSQPSNTPQRTAQADWQTDGQDIPEEDLPSPEELAKMGKNAKRLLVIALVVVAVAVVVYLVSSAVRTANLVSTYGSQSAEVVSSASASSAEDASSSGSANTSEKSGAKGSPWDTATQTGDAQGSSNNSGDGKSA